MRYRVISFYTRWMGRRGNDLKLCYFTSLNSWIRINRKESRLHHSRVCTITKKRFFPPLGVYAVLMIPSSIVAFQVIAAIVAVMSVAALVLVGYLLGFHLYLCKSLEPAKREDWDCRSLTQAIMVFLLTISLFHVGITVQSTELYLNSINWHKTIWVNLQNRRNALAKKYCLELFAFVVFSMTLDFFQAKSNRVSTGAENGTERSNRDEPHSLHQAAPTSIFTIEGNQVW